MDAVVVQDVKKQFGGTRFPVGRSAPIGSARARLRVEEGLPSNPAVVALDHVSFSIATAEIFALVGPASAGKTTLIRMLATLVQPDSGSLRVLGLDVVRQSLQVQRLVNRVSVEASFFRKMSALENLVYGAGYYGLGRFETRARAIELLSRLGLDANTMHQPLEQGSRQTQQMVAIAQALISRPRLLLLDAPTANLDGTARTRVYSLLRELRDQEGITILFATQDLQEAEALSDRMVWIEKGKLTQPSAYRPYTIEEVFQPFPYLVSDER